MKKAWAIIVTLTFLLSSYYLATWIYYWETYDKLGSTSAYITQFFPIGLTHLAIGLSLSVLILVSMIRLYWQILVNKKRSVINITVLVILHIYLILTFGPFL